MKYTTGRVENQKPPHKGWRAVLSYKDDNGKWRRKTKVLNARNKTEATRMMNAWWAEMEAEADPSPAPAPSPAVDATVAEWTSEQVEKLGRSGAITPTTVCSYRNAVNHLGEMGETPLTALDRAAVADWVAGLVDSGLSSASVRKSYNTLKRCLSVAVRDGLIAANPCDGVDLPKNEKVLAGINSLDAVGRDRLKRLLCAVEPSSMVVAASIALYTGLRRGEVCGLRWGDVDLERGVLWVRRSIGVANGSTYLKEPKTGRGRDVAMPATLNALLRAWKRDENAGDVYVVGREDRWASPESVGKEWRVFAKVNGVRGTEGRLCTFHDLRHTWATAAVAAGVDIKTVSSNLGHANAAMTLNIYASADPDAKRRAAKVMDSVI